MNRVLILSLAAALAGLSAAPATAGEVFGGLYVHDVKTPLNLSGIEPGADIQLGYRGGRIGKTPLQPYIFGAVNTAGETNYAAVGVAAKFRLGGVFYVRPGVGIAIHTGSADKFYRTDRIAFGSRVLFEPELGIGADVNDRLSIEASLVHMSHAQLRGRENPGIDNIGVRLNYRL